MSADQVMTQMTLSMPDVSEDDIYVESFQVDDRLGDTYKIVVTFIAESTIKVDDILAKPTQFEFKQAGWTMKFVGILTVIKILEPTHNRQFVYEIWIEPELSLLRHSSQNQVYGTDKDVTVVDIIQAEIADANKASSSTSSDRVARQIQSEMLLTASDYPTLDFVFQYQEDDLNFINRMCERFGIYYAFDHSGDREKVIFGDKKEHFTKLSGDNIPDELPYRSKNQVLGTDSMGVWSFTACYKTASGTVALREYNENKPNVSLSVSASASYEGQGVMTLYGENYPTVSDGEFIAKRRVEQLEGQQLQFQGESNIPNLRPGVFFRLKDHPVSDLDGQYIIIAVKHSCTITPPVGFSSSNVESSPYRNSFVCVPFDKGYRPPVRTPKPLVSGYMVGFIDGETDSKRAELDDHGRYKVRIIDEESGLLNGLASYFVRKMEPYGGGDGYGSHSTLTKDTEVLLGFLQGDPDRPVILGAVSNGELTNPVTSTNQNVAHRTKTSSGIVFQISDGAV